MQDTILFERYSRQRDIRKHFSRFVKIIKLFGWLKIDGRIRRDMVFFKQTKYQKHTMQHALMDKLVVGSLTM